MKLLQKTSLVTTCYNEITNVDRWINDIKCQTFSVDEVCIVDAGSKDGTLEILESWANEDSRVHVKVVKKCNVAQGRNEAIYEASGTIIISTDMGCRIDRLWAEKLTQPLINNSNIGVVAGNYRPDMETVYTEVAKIFYCFNNGYRPKLDKTFLPSNRSIAYRKCVWERLKGYPEWLTFAGDDTLFALKLLNSRIKVVTAPNAFVYWQRHTKLKEYIKESGRYGLGNGEAKLLIKNFWLDKFPHFVKYLILVLIFPFFFIMRDSFYVFIVVYSLISVSLGFFAIQLKRVLISLIKCNLYCFKFKNLFLGYIAKDLSDINYSLSYLKGFYSSLTSLKNKWKIYNEKIVSND